MDAIAIADAFHFNRVNIKDLRKIAIKIIYRLESYNEK